MSCTGHSCRQGRAPCTERCNDWLLDLSEEEFKAEMNRRAGDAFIAGVGVLALALWALGVFA